MNDIAERPSKARAKAGVTRSGGALRALAIAALILAAPLAVRPAAAAMMIEPSPSHDLFIVGPPRQRLDAAPRTGVIGTLLRGAETFIGDDEIPLNGARRAHDLSVAPTVRRVKWVSIHHSHPDPVLGPCAGLHLRNPRDLT